MSIYKRLNDLNITLPELTPPVTLLCLPADRQSHFPVWTHCQD